MSESGSSHVRALILVGIAVVPSLVLFGLLEWLQSSDAHVATRDAEPTPSGSPKDPPALDRITGQLLRPGPLSASHAELEGVTACMTCHGTGSHVPDARCLACHEEIGLRAERRLPLHGMLEGEEA